MFIISRGSENWTELNLSGAFDGFDILENKAFLYQPAECQLAQQIIFGLT